jgi:hypothetical protein
MSRRLNVSLDEEHAAKLARLADRAHVNDGTLARSLLAAAIDDADPDAATITQILEGIPGFDEGIVEAQRDYRSGNVIDLQDL